MGNLLGASYKIRIDENPNDHLKNLFWVATGSTQISQISDKSFTNVSALGKGKFGIVFLAKQMGKDAASTAYVAIKYISKQVIYDTQSKLKIQQEINTLSQSDYPFIVHYFGSFETSHCLAITMEYCYGGELYHRMQHIHKMTEQQAMFYFCEIALALQYLHSELKMVYRDLKPENIMIDYEGHIKLCDFGFTVPINGVVPLQDGCGTVMYMAPELAHMNGIHSYPVDWWALGVITYEMITNETPFGNSQNSTKFEIFNNITEASVRYPLLMSIYLRSLLKGLLEKKPENRYNWDNVRTHSWLKHIDWDTFENRKVKPPWIPQPKDNKPNTDNFISWPDLKLPGGTPLSSNALVYCKDIKLPNGETSNFSSRRGSVIKKAESIKAIVTPKRGVRTTIIDTSASKVSPIEGNVSSKITNTTTSIAENSSLIQSNNDLVKASVNMITKDSAVKIEPKDRRKTVNTVQSTDNATTLVDGKSSKMNSDRSKSKSSKHRNTIVN